MKADEDPRGPEIEEPVGDTYAFTCTNEDEMVSICSMVNWDSI
jgi:hypothetical protein